MLTEFLRDNFFAAAWLSVMTFAWFGWSQEDPPSKARPWLGVGSALGILLAIPLIVQVIAHWKTPSALDGNLVAFIILVWSEVLVAGAGAIFLVKTKRARWIAWWVALVVAVHFFPMAWIFGDLGYLILAIVQTLGLLLLIPRIKASEHASSRFAGPLMGVTFLLFASISATIAFTKLWN